MHSRRLLGLLLLLAFVLAPLAGCWTSSEPGTPDVEEGEPFVLGDLIEPFDPPTLEELNKKVEWTDMPVLDSLELLREKQAGEKPLVSVEEALKLKNDSPENNDKILSALGRLPKNKEQVDYNATIVRHAGADVKSTNPILGSSTIEFDIGGLTGFGLAGFDWNFNQFASKDTVVSWQESKDRMYDKVVMRDDLTWSDGTPITAHDVVFSWKVIMSSQVPVPAMRSGVDKLRWVEAYDDHTLVFFHKEPLAINSWNISFGIIPKHIYEKSIYEDPSLTDSAYHVKYESHPISGGPYVIKERSIGKEIVLERRESWYMHDGKQVRDIPYFKTIRFRIITEPSVALLALEAGDLDEKILSPEEWRTKTNDAGFYKNNTKAYGLEWVYFYFGWNNDPQYAPFFADKRVRKAMSYAFDHEEMLSKLRYGLDEPCNGIFHPTSRWAPDDPPAPYHRDIKKAEQLLEAADWIDHDGDGIRDKEINGRLVPFEFTMMVSNNPDRIAVCELLKQNLSQIGVICNVRPMEFTVMQEKTLKHQFQAYFGGWGTGAYPDTGENLWKTGANRNFVSYSNPKIDALFDKAAASLDDQEREEIFGQIDKILYEDQPYTWLYFRNAYYGFNKSLRGYNFSPRGPYNYGPGFGSIWKTMQ
jgi:peptide/nickel transport system substrate-binding protein